MKKLLLIIPFFLAVRGWGNIVINEVAFDEAPGSPDWVELYNAGPSPVSVDGWRLSDEDAAAGKEIQIQLSTPVPSGAFLLVYVDAAGTDDTGFSNGAAAIYSGTSTTVNLAATEDELSLYSGAPSSTTLVDFVAWVTDGHYDGAGDQSKAVAAGIWSLGDAVSVADTGHGYSIGRLVDGVDTDVPGDFIAFSTPTPRASNVSPQPSPSPVDPPPLSTGTASLLRDVVINEVAWGGTAASASHEWIELFNNSTRAVSLDGWRLMSADTDIDTLLAGTMPPGGYYLLERSSDAPVGDLPADRIYTGSLSNGGEDLLLLDVSTREIDSARFQADGWPGGSGSPDFRSMERVTPSASGDLRVNWRSNDGSSRSGVDAGGEPINGTPRARNSVFSPIVPSSNGGSSGNGAPSGGTCLSIDAAANPFSPSDPAPLRRAARILFNGDSLEAVKTIRITDIRGDVVRSFSESDGLTGAAGVVAWDGRDGTGRLLPPGIYVVDFEAVDPASGERKRGKGTVALGYPK